MNTISIIGLIAGLLTTVAFLPQVVKVIKTKHTRDISLAMYLIFTCGVLFWGTYGILLDELPIILANSVTLVLALIVLVYKIKYK
ncbi:SemiSWEET transporter [Bacteroidota bacterium]